MFEAGNARKVEEDFLVQRDWRADGGKRRVRVTRDDILISRRFHGMEMMISVPVPAYAGVALDVVEGPDGGPAYRLSLAHRDGDLDVVLAETRDSGAAVADWKYWASYLGLPRLAEEADGELTPVDRTTATPIAFPRRGASALRTRRPRFLTRRKPGAPARMAEVFAGEREIICYE
jgi:hypothetical protein